MSERVQKYRDAYTAMDMEALGKLRHPEFQCYYPQSGELFTSHDAWVAAHAGYSSHFKDEPDVEEATVKGGERRATVTATVSPFFMPSAPIVSVSDTGDLVALEGDGTWPDGKVYKWVWIIEYRDHLVWRQTEYYAEPFDPPDWRAAYVEIEAR